MFDPYWHGYMAGWRVRGRNGGPYLPGWGRALWQMGYDDGLKQVFGALR